MNDTEELIKAALAKSAQRAPHSGQIINALNAPRRRTRPALLAIVGAVVVIAAITIPVAFRTPALNPPAAPVRYYTPPAPPPSIPITVKVTDIPAGFVEVSRDADIDGGEQTRGWTNGDGWTFHLTVYTRRSPKWEEMFRLGPDPVQVGGVSVPGWLHGDEKSALIRWMPDGNTVIGVQVYGPPDAGTVAKRVADTVRPDGAAFIRPVLSFGSLPANFNRVSVQASGSSPDTGQTWLWADINGSHSGYVRARIAPKGTAKLDGWNVIVPQPDGREVELQYDADAGLTDQQALDIAKAIKIEQEPDYSWLGK
jgi:hypothetical protein